MSALEGLTPDERAFLMNAPGGWSQAVVDTCDALAARIAELEAQCQRDFALAAEWKAALEAERAEHQMLKDRVAVLLQDAKALCEIEELKNAPAFVEMAEAIGAYLNGR